MTIILGLGLRSVVRSGMIGCLAHHDGRAPDSTTIASISIYLNMQHYRTIQFWSERRNGVREW